MDQLTDKPAWKHSSFSTSDAGALEIARAKGDTYIRGSRAPDSPVIRISNGEWRAFVLAIRTGEFDLQK